ncbi:hypothetical protein EA110_13430, partial [Enterococcus faecalis]|nr:hypothetical protein [Enterococcus faecalis]
MNKILNKISFDDAKNLIETTSTQLYKTQKYKILCLGLFSIFLSLLTVNNSVWTTLILIIIICGSYSLNSLCHVKYQFLIQASDSFTIYLLVQS